MPWATWVARLPTGRSCNVLAFSDHSSSSPHLNHARCIPQPALCPCLGPALPSHHATADDLSGTAGWAWAACAGGAACLPCPFILPLRSSLLGGQAEEEEDQRRVNLPRLPCHLPLPPPPPPPRAGTLLPVQISLLGISSSSSCPCQTPWACALPYSWRFCKLVHVPSFLFLPPTLITLLASRPNCYVLTRGGIMPLTRGAPYRLSHAKTPLCNNTASLRDACCISASPSPTAHYPGTMTATSLAMRAPLAAWGALHSGMALLPFVYMNDMAVYMALAASPAICWRQLKPGYHTCLVASTRLAAVVPSQPVIMP